VLPVKNEHLIINILVFEMYPANHSVVLMDPSSPCIPYNLAGHPSNELWWSGFYVVSDPNNVSLLTYPPISTSANHPKPQLYDIVVSTTDPIWFYCSAPDSCKKYNMVGVININTSKNTLADVKSRAKKVDYSLSPGEKIPGESGNTPSTTSATPAASTDSSTSSGGSSGLSGGAVAGIVIGAIGAFALVGLLFFLIGRKKKAEELRDKERIAADAEIAAAKNDQQPPMYQDPAIDPRYSMAVGSPPPQRDTFYAGKQGHESLMADHTGQSLMADHTGHTVEERNPHRLSELPSQNYDPVEIYTPGLPEHMEFPNSPAEDERNRRRD